MFKYKIEFYSNYDNENKIKIAEGILGADNYTEAMTKLIDCFWEENIVNILSLYALEDPLDKEEIMEMFKED